MTNEKLIQIVNDELEMYMRDDIRMRIHYHKRALQPVSVHSSGIEAPHRNMQYSAMSGCTES